ncbi:MAG: hypothetical protein HWD59_08495 [Coxiellaceae bacterium]|nr:MAG: hypothetical protein HWD59_08495 [Coxiellaceae bacterium]
MVQSTELRETIGERAKLRALMQFGPEALLAAMQTVYRLNYNAIKPTIFIDTALTTTEDISVIARLKEMAELHALQAPLTVTDKRNAWCIVKTNAEIALAKQAGLKSILLRTHHCRDDRDYFCGQILSVIVWQMPSNLL